MLGFRRKSRLQQLVLSPDVGVESIGVYLDDLDEEERWKQVKTLGRQEQRSLFLKAKADVSLEDFVPAVYEEGQPVRHLGRNTLPVPPPHHLFEKRFARSITEPGVLYGYNKAPSQRVLGPGYFVAVPTAGRTEWEKRGDIVIDYFQTPRGMVPEEWPVVKPNSQGLQQFVYRGTRDFMRKVSTHVTIGAVFKGEKALDHYFLLCRVL